PGLQRGGDDLQHAPRSFSNQLYREHIQFRAGRTFRHRKAGTKRSAQSRVLGRLSQKRPVDFFERQDEARRHTKLLVVYFAAAVLSLVVVINAVVLLVLASFGSYGVPIWKSIPISSVAELSLPFSQAELLFCVTIGTLVVILIGSVFKTLQLARGGSAVAELLGGRLIDSNTTDADERKLLNVVEEMSIASGVPVPQVYLMDGEAGINAFAAGHSTSDAAISVTRGCMKLLSRDQLQGVIAHA